MIAVGSRLPLLLAVLVPVAAGVAELRQSWVDGVGVVIMVTVVMAAIDAVRAGSPGSISITRDAPAAVVLGSEAHMSWHLVNEVDRPRSVGIADDFAPSLGAQRRAHIDLPAFGVGEVTIAFRPARRGLFKPTQMTVRVDGPWRLMSRQRSRMNPAEIRVVPAFLSKREVELRLHRARLLEIGSRSVRARGGGTEFDHLRDFSVDDSYRHIDWGGYGAGRAANSAFVSC